MNGQELADFVMSKFHEGDPEFESLEIYCAATNDSEKSGDNGSAPKIIRNHFGDIVRQPCKARGVTVIPGQNPHVARYAYIDIPAGSIHGTVLSCCHPTCIASGRRFRYCSHCKTAVAKRNFNVRHAHGNLNSPPAPPFGPNTVPDYDVANATDHDGAETSIPTVISIGDLKDSKSCSDNSTCMMVSLSLQEYEIIKLLRSRPANDYPQQVTQWKETLLRITEFEQTCEIQDVPESSSDAERDNSCSATDDDYNASFSVDDFGIVDVDDFFEE